MCKVFLETPCRLNVFKKPNTLHLAQYMVLSYFLQCKLILMKTEVKKVGSQRACTGTPEFCDHFNVCLIRMDTNLIILYRLDEYLNSITKI